MDCTSWLARFVVCVVVVFGDIFVPRSVFLFVCYKLFPYEGVFGREKKNPPNVSYNVVLPQNVCTM